MGDRMKRYGLKDQGARMSGGKGKERLELLLGAAIKRW
tara:strand:+ start:307 stop:420 length:114 start_codon:yes stop_codon:yes gene_type:complete